MGNTEETATEETLEREGTSNAGRGDTEPAREVQAPDGCPSPLEIRPYDPSEDPDADTPDPEGDGTPEPWETRTRDALLAVLEAQRLAFDAIRDCAVEDALGQLALDINTLETVAASLRGLIGADAEDADL